MARKLQEQEQPTAMSARASGSLHPESTGARQSLATTAAAVGQGRRRPPAGEDHSLFDQVVALLDADHEPGPLDSRPTIGSKS